MDYDAILRVFADEFSEELVQRRIGLLQQVAAHNARGFKISELPAIANVISAGFRALEEHGQPFVAPLCELVSIFGLPYLRSKAREEASNAAPLVDLLRIVVAVLVWDVPDIQLAAVQALESFVRAEGFEETTYQAETGAMFKFHQRLLLEADALNGLLLALRHHVAVFAEVAGKPIGSEALGVSGELADGDDALTGGDAPSSGLQGVGAGTRAGLNLVKTYAVRSAAVKRAPELLNVLARVIRECSAWQENGLALIRLGAPSLVMSLVTHFSGNVREPLLHTAVEILWNLLEHSSTTFGAAAVGGDPAQAAVSMVELLDKHRGSNTVRQLGTPRDVLALGALLESCVAHARTQADKEFRNDVLVVLSLLARKPENRPLFASTGVLSLLLSFGTAAEIMGANPHGPVSVDDPAMAGMNVDAEVPLDRYVTSSPVDVEFKQMIWTTVVTLTQGPYADFEVRPAGRPTAVPGEELEEDIPATATCLSIVRSSYFLKALLMHVDPSLALPVPAEQLLGTMRGRSMFKVDGVGSKTTGSRSNSPQTSPHASVANVSAAAAHVHPYLASLPIAARRALEIQALDILTALCPAFAEEIVAHGGLEILSSYLRTYTDVLNGSASLKVAVDHRHDHLRPHPVSPSRLSHREQKVLRETMKQTMDLSGTMPGSQRSTVPFIGKHDTGRQFGALRLLHAILDVNVRHNAEAHLSNMITAGVPTVVASETAKMDLLSGQGEEALGVQSSLSRPDLSHPDSLTDVSMGSVGDGAGSPNPRPVSALPTASSVASLDGVSLGVRAACRLGELELGSDLVTVLKGLPQGGGEADEAANVAPADTLTYSAFGRTWSGVAGAAGLGKTKAVASGGSHGRGVLSVTDGAFLAEGRSIVRVGMLKEEVLACLAAMTSMAATVSSTKQARLLHEMMEADALNVEVAARARAEARPQGEEVEGEASQAASVPNSVAIVDSVPPRVSGLGLTDVVRQRVIEALVANQDQIRKAGGVPALLRVIIECTGECQNRAGGEWGTSTSQPRVATVACYALRCAVSGNVRSEARFLAESGIDALMDMVEVAPPTLMPVLLTTLADLSRNPISHVCVRSWRSDSTGCSAGSLLLDLWRKEEQRLGVVHDAATGALNNPARPLDGSDAAARQLALFHASHSPTAAAVKRIKPGGRQALMGGAPGSTQILASTSPQTVSPEASHEVSPRAGASSEGEQDANRSDGQPSDTVAFRALRRALKAAKLWKQVESDPPGGPVALLVASMDLRHKLYSCLQAVGFDEIDREMERQAAVAAEARSNAATAGGRGFGNLEAESKKSADEDEDEDDAIQARDMAIVMAENSVYSTLTGSTQADAEDKPTLGQFPDLTVPHRVSLELVKAYDQLLRGAAWDDVRARLNEMGSQPLPEDLALIEAHLSAVQDTASRIQALQLIEARREEAAVHAREVSTMARAVQRRADEADALLFNERTKRKPGVSQGKAFAGLNMDEKKAGWAARAKMVGKSYNGYKPRPGQPPATDDGVPWGQIGK